jgi:hypothetical protein
MPFPKEAQKKGGSRPATESQKEAAKQWAIANQPWLNSTGPKSWEGKHTSSVNAIKATYSREVKSWESENFDGDCASAEEAIAELQRLFDESPDIGFISITRRFGEKDGKRWACYAVKLKRKIYHELSLEARIAQQVWRLRNLE